MAKGCINNTIQKYIEDIVKYLEISPDESLYELYKEIRTEIASYGMITMKGSNKCISNPKSISASIVYIWAYANGVIATQQDLADATGLTMSTIRMNYKHIIKWLKSKDISIPVSSND